MAVFNFDNKSGLLSFTQLERTFGINNYVTYDTAIWGNMSPKYSIDDTEKEVIAKKDRSLAIENFETDTIVSISTPLEPSILHFTKETFQVLEYANERDAQGFLDAVVTANVIILEVPKIELVFAPADCAIAFVVHPQWKGVMAIHLGAALVAQDTHYKGLKFLKFLTDIDVSGCSVFITPYICPLHYLLSTERKEHYLSIQPNLDDYFQEVEHGLFGFDFIALVKDDLQRDFGISQFFESGLCTYEEAQRGNMFSHRLSTQQPDKYKEGRFNVCFGIA